MADETDAGVDAPDDVTPPAVVSVSPADQSNIAGIGVAVTATFSEAILPSSVSGATFSVKLAGVPVSGTLATSGPTVAFIASENLSPNTRYDVSINPAVSDLANNPLGQVFAWSFTTSSGGWTPPALLETELAKAASGLVSSVRNGTGLAAWTMVDCPNSCATSGTPWFAHYQAGTWSTAAPLTQFNGKSPVGVFVDESGRGVMLLVVPGAVNSLEAATYDAGIWSAAVPIEADDAGTISSVVGSGTANGDVFVAWRRIQGSTFQIWSNRYSPAMGWGTETRLDASSDTADNVAIASIDGMAIAGWLQSSTAKFRVFTSGSWGVVGTPGAATIGGASAPRIALPGDGSAMAIWGNGTAVQASRYTGAWSVPVSINGTAALAGPMTLAADSSRAIALWPGGPAGSQSVYQSVYSSSWGPATAIDTLPGPGNDVGIVFGSSNQAMAHWTQTQGAAGSPAAGWAATFSPVRGWDLPQLISSDSMFSITDLQVYYDSAANSYGSLWLEATTNLRSVFESRLE